MRSTLDKILPWLWALVWFTIPISLKASSASLILLVLVVAIRAYYRKPEITKSQIITSILFILLFAWHGISYFFDGDLAEVKFSLERKLAFVTIPIIILLMDPKSFQAEKWAIRGFFMGLGISGIHLIFLAFLKMASGLGVHEWTYHAFIGPYPHGAIYYSWYLSSAILYIMYGQPEFLLKKYKLGLVIFFLILLFFSASKFFIALTLPLVIWRLLKNWFKLSGRKKTFALTAGLLFVFLGMMPFLNRINELKNTQLEVVNLDKFAYDTPFNGLTFRMLEWRLAVEILNDEQSWTTGVGIGSRQTILNDYYKNYGIYLGNPDLGDTGYLNYNFHNQYLEVLVGTGIPGLILLLLVLINMFANNNKQRLFPLMVYTITVLFFGIESVLERQSGIIFFCLISCFFISFRSSNITHFGISNTH